MRKEQYDNSDVTKERYEQATDSQQFVFEACWEMWDPRTVIPMEVGDWYTSELQEDKDIHTVLDCSCAIDYLVDPFTEPPFGLNHRVHSPTDATLSFDLRAENNNQSESELETLRNANAYGEIVPKYATRLKKSESGIEWLRVVHLAPIVEAIKDGIIPPLSIVREYSGDDYTAWYFDYDWVEEMDCLVAEFNNQMEKVHSDPSHESLQK